MGESWRCNCGELILHGYSECWKCGTLRLPEGELVPSKPLARSPSPSESESEADEHSVAAAVDGPPGPANPKERLWLWAEVGAVVLLFVFPMTCFGVWDLIEPPKSVTSVENSLSSFIRDVHVLAPVLYILARSGIPWKHFGFVKPRAFDVVQMLVILFSEFTIHRAQVLVSALLPLEWNWSGWVHPVASGASEILLAAFTTILHAFTQEIVMRAYLVPRLETLLRSTSKAVLISGLLFASYHLYQGINATMEHFVVGLLYGTVFAVTRRIWPLVAAHAVWNNLVQM